MSIESLLDAARKAAHPTTINLDDFKVHERGTGARVSTSGIAMSISKPGVSSSTVFLGKDIQSTLRSVIHTGFVMFLTKAPDFMLVQSVEEGDPRAYPVRQAPSKQSGQIIGTLHITLPIPVIKELKLHAGRYNLKPSEWYVEDDFLLIDLRSL